jgi:thiaminase/transcriptional activator TenA
MSFSNQSWTRIEGLYRRILALPFNQELAAGTLSRERFVFYMLQDAHYLVHFARALAVTAARAGDVDDVIQFAGSAREAVVVERALHEGFFRDYGITPEQAAATEPSPTCSHYTHYLLALAHNAPYEVAVAALLPCFWIYWEVGRHLHGIAAPANPYQAWIDTYADEAFAAGVRKVIAIGDRLGAAATPAIREDMHLAFQRSSQLEWMFWDSAYRLERWLV